MPCLAGSESQGWSSVPGDWRRKSARTSKTRWRWPGLATWDIDYIGGYAVRLTFSDGSPIDSFFPSAFSFPLFLPQNYQQGRPLPPVWCAMSEGTFPSIGLVLRRWPTPLFCACPRRKPTIPTTGFSGMRCPCRWSPGSSSKRGCPRNSWLWSNGPLFASRRFPASARRWRNAGRIFFTGSRWLENRFASTSFSSTRAGP